MPDNTHKVRPSMRDERVRDVRLIRTQKDTANIGVTPRRGGTIPRYNLQPKVNDISHDHNSGDGIPCYTIASQSLPDDI